MYSQIVCIYIYIYIYIYVCFEDLALNNLQCLICHKTQPTIHIKLLGEDRLMNF